MAPVLYPFVRDGSERRVWYWSWFKYRDNPTKIPLFDGSEYNIGGDGKFWEQHGSTAGMDFVKIPSGDSGGCITTGPLPK
ncbi:hypothetical protein ACHAP6_008327 [Verticillium nonalfalfae]